VVKIARTLAGATVYHVKSSAFQNRLSAA
jgi:hypothetical protein